MPTLNVTERLNSTPRHIYPRPQSINATAPSGTVAPMPDGFDDCGGEVEVYRR